MEAFTEIVSEVQSECTAMNAASIRSYFERYTGNRLTGLSQSVLENDRSERGSLHPSNAVEYRVCFQFKDLFSYCQICRDHSGALLILLLPGDHNLLDMCWMESLFHCAERSTTFEPR